MAPRSPRLVLASGSPQRRAILERLGVRFTVRRTDCEEIEHGDPGEVALSNAVRKARAALARATGEEAVLGADTLVALEGRIYGKPRDERQARSTLEALSGATHEVVSGLALLIGDRAGGEIERRTAIARTTVTFRALDEAWLAWSLARGEWRGRAGGYAIQGGGAALVLRVEGDYENIVGLPLASLLEICPKLLFACK